MTASRNNRQTLPASKQTPPGKRHTVGRASLQAELPGPRGGAVHLCSAALSCASQEAPSKHHTHAPPAWAQLRLAHAPTLTPGVWLGTTAESSCSVNFSQQRAALQRKKQLCGECFSSQSCHTVVSCLPPAPPTPAHATGALSSR